MCFAHKQYVVKQKYYLNNIVSFNFYVVSTVLFALRQEKKTQKL